jgi:hypothetical protein
LADTRRRCVRRHPRPPPCDTDDRL